MLVNKDSGKTAAVAGEEQERIAAAKPNDEVVEVASSGSTGSTSAPIPSVDEMTIAPPPLFPAEGEASSTAPRSNVDHRLNLVSLRLNVEHTAKEAARGAERASKTADATATEAVAAERRMEKLVSRSAGAGVARSLADSRRRLRHEGEDLATFKWEEDERMRRIDDLRAVERRLAEDRAAADRAALDDYDYYRNNR